MRIRSLLLPRGHPPDSPVPVGDAAQWQWGVHSGMARVCPGDHSSRPAPGPGQPGQGRGRQGCELLPLPSLPTLGRRASVSASRQEPLCPYRTS